MTEHEAAGTTEHQTSAEHSGPHIPSTMGTPVEGLPSFVTTTVVSTWVVMLVLFAFVGMLRGALSKKSSKLKSFGLDVMGRLDAFLSGTVGSKDVSRKYFWLLGSFFVFIFAANLVGLILDWIILVAPKAAAYVRPVNSDLNTTLVMGLTAVVVAQGTAIYRRGPVKHFAHYLANWHGASGIEKGVNVFVGWLHFIGEFIRIGSLSLRLFLNIFAGAILISVMIYIGSLIPGIGPLTTLVFSLPFWFFELLVAFLQAYIFTTLSGIYLREAVEDLH